jgi:Zn-finger nucleic acid-binding protein
LPTLKTCKGVRCDRNYFTRILARVKRSLHFGTESGQNQDKKGTDKDIKDTQKGQKGTKKGHSQLFTLIEIEIFWFWVIKG